METKKKYRYDPIKISLIIVIGTILLILFLNKTYKENIRYAIMTCTSNTGAPEHSETVTFKFLAKKDGVLYEFFRDEVYHYDSEDNINKTYDYLVDYRNNMKSIIDTTNLRYDIKKDNKEIYVNTYIKVGTLPEIFNNYAQSVGLTKDSTAKEVYETMTINDSYTCIETESM